MQPMVPLTSTLKSAMGQHLSVNLHPTWALSQPHLISAPGLSAGDLSAGCEKDKVPQTVQAQLKPRSRLTANLKRLQTNSDLTVAKPTGLAIIITKIQPSASRKATRKGLAMSKPVSGYFSLPAQPFLVDVLYTYMFNTDCK